MLGARVAGDPGRFEGSFGALGGRDGAQIVSQGLPLLGEAALDELQEARFLPGCQAGQVRSFAWWAHPDKRGSNSWARSERGGRNPQENFRSRVELREGGKVAVLPPPGPSHEPGRNFELDDDGNQIDLVRLLEEAMQDRRGDVIGQISVHLETPAGQLREIEREHVCRDNFNMGSFAGEFAQLFNQPRIDFDGHHPAREPGEFARHFAVPRADFEPDVFASGAEGAQDALPPGDVGEKMLSQWLAGHGRRRV